MTLCFQFLKAFTYSFYVHLKSRFGPGLTCDSFHSIRSQSVHILLCVQYLIYSEDLSYSYGLNYSRVKYSSGCRSLKSFPEVTKLKIWIEKGKQFVIFSHIKYTLTLTCAKHRFKPLEKNAQKKVNYKVIQLLDIGRSPGLTGTG